MQRIGARELKQRTGQVIERIQRGERLLLTHRGSPIAIITPINRAAFDQLLEREAHDAESLAWLGASESAFGFWDNAEDEDWDKVQSRPLE
jgi:prevent-host-death family protein